MCAISVEGRAGEGTDFIPIIDRRIRWGVRPGFDRVNPRTATANDAPLRISIIDDDVSEPTEYFEVHFVVDSTGFASPDAIARITILDNDDGMRVGAIKNFLRGRFLLNKSLLYFCLAILSLYPNFMPYPLILESSQLVV
jgi:hypothetical protein